MDRYSKTVLTIIALALVWIGVKDFSPVSDAMAANGIVAVKIVEMDLNRYKPIPVKVEGKLLCESR